MYSLKVRKELTTEDGRLFLPDHDAQSLSSFEVSELVTDYPDCFEAADEATAEFLKNTENIAHLADAVKRKNLEGKVESQGNVSTRKTK